MMVMVFADFMCLLFPPDLILSPCVIHHLYDVQADAMVRLVSWRTLT